MSRNGRFGPTLSSRSCGPEPWTSSTAGNGPSPSGIAASRAGAARVWAIDTDPVAQIALKLNAAANHAEITLWDGPDQPESDLVLAGDVFYDAAVVAHTLPILTEMARRGARVLVGDPFRRSLPRDRLTLLAEYAVPDMGGREPVRSGVFVLHP